MGSAGQDWEGECGVKEGSFQDVIIMSLLPGVSQIRTFLKVYGAEPRNGTKLIIIITCGNPRVGVEYTFPLAPSSPPALSLALEVPSPNSLSLSRMPQKVMCRL